MIVQIILDIIMIIVLVIGMIKGETEVSVWVTLLWVFIAFFAHLQLKSEHDLHRN